MYLLHNNDFYYELLALLGGVVVVYYVLKALVFAHRGIRSFLVSPCLKIGTNPLNLGAWAVVTGATDGIGKGYCKALAKRGVNIVLMSRSKDKLEDVAQELMSDYKVSTKCVAVDFSGGVEIYDRLEREIEGIDVGLLVNNVGMSLEYPEYFHSVPDREHTYNRLLHVNIFSVTFLTAIILPQMLNKGQGAIVNVGSSSSSYGFPLLSVYSATKAYVDKLSQNLACEYASKGIIIQSLLPQVVTTKMSKVKKPGFSSPSADSFAESALNTLGLDGVTTGYYSHWLVDTVVSLLPEWITIRLVFKIGLGLRSKALKKKQK